MIYNCYRPTFKLEMKTPNQMYEQTQNRANCLTRFEVEYCQSISGQDSSNKICRQNSSSLNS